MDTVNAIFDFFFSAIRSVIGFTLITGILFLPLWLLIYFLVCVKRFFAIRKLWDRAPNVPQKQMRREYMLKMILSGVLTAAFAAAWVVIYVTFIDGITYM